MGVFPPYLQFGMNFVQKVAIFNHFMLFCVQNGVNYPIFVEFYAKNGKKPPTSPHICILAPKTAQKRAKSGHFR